MNYSLMRDIQSGEIIPSRVKLTSNDGQTFIFGPDSPDDWNAYQAWLAEGNEAEDPNTQETGQ